MMSRKFFPDPLSSDASGVLAMGGELRTDLLLEAYENGIFPWPHEGLPLLWFFPRARGVWFLEKAHFPKRLLQRIRNEPRKLTWNQAFERVMLECAKAPRKEGTGTWITPEMQQAYLELHRLGYAFSVECWWREELVGGLYGVMVKGVCNAESMFFKESDASKRCLYFLREKMQAKGVEWIDVQMITPVMEALGGEYIDAEKYLELLRNAQSR